MIIFSVFLNKKHLNEVVLIMAGMLSLRKKKNYLRIMTQEGHEALNCSPEYTGQSQTFNFEI